MPCGSVPGSVLQHAGYARAFRPRCALRPAPCKSSRCLVHRPRFKVVVLNTLPDTFHRETRQKARTKPGQSNSGEVWFGHILPSKGSREAKANRGIPAEPAEATAEANNGCLSTGCSCSRPPCSSVTPESCKFSASPPRRGPTGQGQQAYRGVGCTARKLRANLRVEQEHNLTGLDMDRCRAHLLLRRL